MFKECSDNIKTSALYTVDSCTDILDAILKQILVKSMAKVSAMNGDDFGRNMKFKD